MYFVFALQSPSQSNFMVKELCKVRLSFIFILTSQLIITFLATAIEVMVRITYRPHFFHALFLVLFLSGVHYYENCFHIHF